MNIGGFLKNSFVDYPGHIACVIFTSGCNFDCWYCHNRELLHSNKNLNVEEIIEYLKSRIGLIEAVVISGGEPTLQGDLVEFIESIKSMNFKVKLDTNGTNHKVLKYLDDNCLVDYVAMDIKAPLDKYSKVVCKNVDISSIEKSIEILKKGKVDYEFRTTFSPDLSADDIEKIFNLIPQTKNYYLQKHIPQKVNNYREHTYEDFLNCQEIGKKYGVDVSFRNL